MKARVLKQKKSVFILIAILMVTFGTLSISYGQEANLTITASVEEPLTEATLHRSVVTLTLSGGIYGRQHIIFLERYVNVLGIQGVTIKPFDMERVSDTQLTAQLEFSGNIDTDATLTFSVGAEAIEDYDGNALTATLPVTAVEESLEASTKFSLTEASLNRCVVILTLNGRIFNNTYNVSNALTVSGIEGASFHSYEVEHISFTQVTVLLTFSGNIDADSTLTLTVGGDAIIGYNKAFTVQLSVPSVEESLVASTEAPLTEATLGGSVVILTLSGRVFNDRHNVYNALTVSGIEGASFDRLKVERISGTQVTVPLKFSGNIDVDSTLTLTVGGDAINGYNEAFTFQLSVSAVEESLVASIDAPLTEAGGGVRLTLNGRRFAFVGNRAVTFSDIEGVTVESNVRYVSLDGRYISPTEIYVVLTFDGNFDNDTTLTITVTADAIANYNKDLSVQLPVTAVEESLVASTRSPLTEAISWENVITLTLSGRRFAGNIEDALTFSGIEGVTVIIFDGVEHISDTEVRFLLLFNGNFSTDATLTLTVGADAILGYNRDFTFQFPVTAVEESLTDSTEFALTEGTLNGSVVKLSLNGRWFDPDLDIDNFQDALTVSGIEGVTVSYVEPILYSVEGLSDTAEAAAFWGLSLKEAEEIVAYWGMGLTELAIQLAFEGDFDTDATLTIAVPEPIIVGYNKGLTVELPVTAIGQSDATISISPSPIELPAIGEKLTFNLDIANGENVAGYQATVLFDPSVLRYVESANGDYFPVDAFFVDPIFDDYIWLRDTFVEDTNRVTIAGNTLAGAGNGDGTLATLTFEVYDHKPATVTLSEVYLVDSDGRQWDVTTQNGEVIKPQELPQKIFGDINSDGVVNIVDLVIVGDHFGLRGQSSTDVNGDHLVDIVDLVLVANAIGADAAAPSLNPKILELFTAADVKEWLNQARKITPTDPDFRRGISMLEQLHKALIPKETALLPNFPNPFNPETWIPYHLTKDTDVTLHIYTMNGTLVRTLALGHQPAGMYQTRNRAAYWDGKNQIGEPVASGVYFHTITAGNFTATRKMLIRK